MESVVLDISAEPRPPTPRAEALGPFLCMLAGIPLEAWTAYFEQAVMASDLSIGRAMVVSDPAASRCVLLENCDNSEKDSDPLTVEDHNRRTPHSKTI
jgi:hypothetical protein